MLKYINKIVSQLKYSDSWKESEFYYLLAAVGGVQVFTCRGLPLNILISMFHGGIFVGFPIN